MTYRLVALDIDGTLLNDQGHISARTKKTIREVGEASVHIVLCSGRSPHQCKPIIERLELDGTIITHNGAATVDTRTNQVIYESSFSIQEVAPFIEYCRKYDIHFYVCTAFDLYVERMDAYQLEVCKKYDLAYVTIDDVLKIQDSVMKFTIDDQKKIGGWQNFITSQRKYVHGYFMDVMHQEANKKEALSQLCVKMGIDRSEVMAIGDFYNDLSMIEFAGLGVAMGNAPEDLKQKADAVTYSNNEDGVHEALMKYILR